MSREKNLLLAELSANSDDVGDKFIQSVGGHAAGLAAEVVAALVGHDHAKTRSGQRLDLSVPSVPKFREAVEQNYNLAVSWTGSHCVQADIATFEGKVFHEHPLSTREK